MASAGQTTATQAPAGTYVANTGQSAATKAPAGSYVASAGQTVATQAAAGTYVDTQGASQATPAPAGTYVSTEGASQPTPAPIGSYVANTGQTTASLAPVGTYVDIEGASQVTPAPAGSFVGTQGASQATLAPVGSYVAVSGAISAEPCPTDSNSYGGSVACRQTTPAAAISPFIVSPDFSSTYGTDGSYDLGAFFINDPKSISFDIFNISNDLGFSDLLTDLSILNIQFAGVHADYFSLNNLFSIDVIHEQESKSFDFTITPDMYESFDVTMSISTDQYADFNANGREFTFNFFGTVLPIDVPEPSAFILMMTGIAGLFYRRKICKNKHT